MSLSGESQGRGSLVGCRLWGCTESDTTEATEQQQQTVKHNATLGLSQKGREVMGSQSWTGLSDFPFTFHFHALEKEMETHSSVLAWRVPGTGEPGGLPSLGSHRVGHD